MRKYKINVTTTLVGTDIKLYSQHFIEKLRLVLLKYQDTFVFSTNYKPMFIYCNSKYSLIQLQQEIENKLNNDKNIYHKLKIEEYDADF
jgi:hypothetical protein